MKTFETEKNNIPDGATHYQDPDAQHVFAWFKLDGNKLSIKVPHGEDFGWDECKYYYYKGEITPIPKPEVVEWKNGDDLDWLKPNNRWCESEHMFVGEKSNGHPVIEHKTTGNVFETYWSAIRKPESQEEKEKRERLEAAYDLYCHVQSTQNQTSATFELFTKRQGIMTLHRERYLAIVDKTNYRKGE